MNLNYAYGMQAPPPGSCEYHFLGVKKMVDLASIKAPLFGSTWNPVTLPDRIQSRPALTAPLQQVYRPRLQCAVGVAAQYRRRLTGGQARRDGYGHCLDDRRASATAQTNQQAGDYQPTPDTRRSSQLVDNRRIGFVSHCFASLSRLRPYSPALWPVAPPAGTFAGWCFPASSWRSRPIRR